MAMEHLTIDEFNRARGAVKDLKKQLAEAVTLWLPKLPRATHPNARSHWRAKAAATRQQRSEAFLVAKEAIGLSTQFPWTAAQIDMTYFTIATLVDRQNLIGWGKASMDGLQDAGLILNDSGFTFGPVHVVRVKSADPRKGMFQLSITRTQ